MTTKAQDTYFLKKKAKTTKPRKTQKKKEIASLIFPAPKKTIILPLEKKVLPADRIDYQTLTPYDIDEDGLPTAEFLQRNPQIISMTSGPARGMLLDKLKKANALKLQSQKALVDLPALTMESIKDRRDGITALINMMDQLPERIRGDLLDRINQRMGELAQAQVQPKVEPLEPELEEELQTPLLKVSETSVPSEDENKQAYVQFKTKYDSLPDADKAQVLKGIRKILQVEGQNKREPELLQMMQKLNKDEIKDKYYKTGLESNKRTSASVKDTLSPYSVGVGSGLKRKTRR